MQAPHLATFYKLPKKEKTPELGFFSMCALSTMAAG